MAQLQREDMTVLSEIGLADNSKLSATEVIEILQRNHTLPAGPHYDAEWEKFGTKSDSDYYQTLTSRIYQYTPMPPDPLPALLSDTCKQLRGRILKWFCNPSRNRSMFWITDPFTCVRDLGVVYTFTSMFMALNRLGANSQIRSKSSIFEVIRQLASQYPPYRGLLIRELVDDPMILKNSLHILFKRLIVKPWDTLAASHPLYLQKPPLIILEFIWDPADTHDPDSIAVIELVQGYNNHRKPTPLLWLICSHPNDRQLNQPLLTIDAQPVYEHEAWTYDSAEAQQDVNDLLHCGLQRIRQNHSAAFVEDEKWPSDAQLHRLADAIFGVSHFACAVVQFVGAKGKDPKKQLETCIQYTTGCPRPSTLHPFSGLDHFYHQMVSNLPPRALHILWVSSYSHTCYMSNFLKIDQIELYDLISDNLDHLSTLRPIKHRDYGHELKSRDRTFAHFLRHAVSSGIYSDRYAEHVRLSLPRSGTFSAIVSGMTWKPSRPKDLWKEASYLRRLGGFLSWATYYLEDGGYDQLSKFDFRDLVPISAGIPSDFYRVLLRLKERQPKDEYPLVRTELVFPSDHQLIEKCGTVAIPMRFDGGSEWPEPVFPQYALVGYGTQTVLIIMFWPFKTSTGYLPAFDVYSLEMLDDL